MSHFARAIAAVCLALAPVAAIAAGDPRVVELLFESRHLDLIDKGAGVTYRFEKKGSNEQLVGKNLTDELRLNVSSVNGKGERDVVFHVFTGEQARDPQNWPDLTINPLFVWYLDRAVTNFRYLAGGDARYLKRKFQLALRDSAKIQDIKYEFDGKTIDAQKVTIRPYADDVRNKDKMQGFENTEFTVVVSKEVPGFFVDLTSSFVSTQAAAPSIEEKITLVGMGEAK
ncbi:hypothetical protein W911_13310 [Hyphomicrobium nitrativorans NL23]|uniref:Uncharacterized protein n=1 Tax=Hyphomicrobium nitrativorans NL23 TaxID=1029756 RepID=V5SHE1_9HYPH|nr:hypothetical protein [Hyphomicrobium nitrativorans]AHB50286.1 hypothetical protein W911_13310 [Hyphomicrobium nitrativorans NL23]